MELEYLVEHLPTRQAEGAWLAKTEKLSADLQKFCQQLPTLAVSELLQTRVARAVADVRSRSRNRSRTLTVASVSGLLVCAFLVAALLWWLNELRLLREAVAYAESLLPGAELGEFVDRTERLKKHAGRYEENSDFATALGKFDRAAKAEADRRREFGELLSEHAELLVGAEESLEDRQSPETKRLEEWPDVVFDAAKKYELARLKGGFPENRRIQPGRGRQRQQANDEDDIPPLVKQQFESEETRLAEHFDRQKSVTMRFERGAIQEFERQHTQIQKAIPAEDAPDAKATAARLLEELDALLAESKKPQSSRVKSGERVPYLSGRDLAKETRAILTDLLKPIE